MQTCSGPTTTLSVNTKIPRNLTKHALYHTSPILRYAVFKHIGSEKSSLFLAPAPGKFPPAAWSHNNRICGRISQILAVIKAKKNSLEGPRRPINLTIRRLAQQAFVRYVSEYNASPARPRPIILTDCCALNASINQQPHNVFWPIIAENLA